mgnify:CR=1 FL=1
MATEKKITSRIQQKHDVAANWAKATNFIPKKGEIIIYDAEYNASGEETQAVRFKIGDGTKTVVNLPFAVIDYKNEISNLETSLGEAEQDIADNSTAIGKIQGAFESDGTTIKKATSAGTADKVANKLTFRQTSSGVVKELVFDGSKNQAVDFTGGLASGYDETNAILNVEMEDSGVTSGTYNKVTVNKKGCVTAGENVNYLTSHQSIKSINTNNTTAQSVNSSEAVSGSGTINLHKVAKTGSYNDLLNKPTIPSVSGKLNKTTYEYNEELALGSNGKVLIGIFPMYDTNLTIRISSTTNVTYSGTLVIATQNFGTANRAIICNLYGDATGTLYNCLVVQQSADVTDPTIKVYGNFAGYSKNLVHIQAVGLEASPEDLMGSTTSIPTTDLVTIHNVLSDNFAKLSADNKFTGEMAGIGHPYRVFQNEDAYAAYFSDPTSVKYTSQTNAAFIANTDSNNRTLITDGLIRYKKAGTQYDLTLPTEAGTLMVGTKFSSGGTTPSSNAYLPYTSSDNTSPVYIITFLNDGAEYGLCYCTTENVRKKMNASTFSLSGTTLTIHV